MLPGLHVCECPWLIFWDCLLFLFDKMMYQIQYNCSPTISELVSKECAKIVCNEFIDAMSTTHIGYCKEPFNAYYKKKKDYWQAVKAEIEKL
jgi:hypothetical protein